MTSLKKILKLEIKKVAFSSTQKKSFFVINQYA